MRHFILCILAILSMGADAPKSHQWGETEAVFAGIKGSNVHLRFNNQIKVIPLSDLSEADRKFATENLANCRVTDGKVIAITDGDTITILDFEKNKHYHPIASRKWA